MKSKTIWISGLLAGAALGAYLYRNQTKTEPQQRKFKKLISDLKSVAGDLKEKLVSTGQEGLEQTKKKLDAIKN